MITTSNIRQYIGYLYFTKYNKPAPPELLIKWAALSNAEIRQNLDVWYTTSYGISIQDGAAMEQNYIAGTSQTTTTFEPTSNTHTGTAHTPPPFIEQKKMSPWPIVGALLIGVALAAGIYYFVNINNGTEIATATSTSPVDVPATLVDSTTPIAPPTDTTVPTEVTTTPAVDSSAKPTATVTSEKFTKNIFKDALDDINSEDAYNIKTMRSFFNEEVAFFNSTSGADPNPIINNFASGLEKYFAIPYPTNDELRNEYYASKTKKSNVSYKYINATKIADNEYAIRGEISFYSEVDKVQKTKEFKSLMRFSNDNKIKWFGN